MRLIHGKRKLSLLGKLLLGIPGVETLLPLMLDAVSRGRLTLKRLLELTRYNPEKIFALPPHDDVCACRS